jgi:RNA-directed DNA polymerase
MRALRGANAAAVIRRLNPIIRGWSAYYRTVVSSQVFSKLDHHTWTLSYRWAKRGHPNKSKHWVAARYFGPFNRFRNDRWVFGDRDSGVYLLKHSWTKIVRHQLVPGTASPDDPSLAEYWARRRQHHTPPLDGVSLRQLKAQHGRCAACGGLLLLADREPQSPSEWEQWLSVTRKAVRRQAVTALAGPGRPDDIAAFHLVHAHCQRRADPATSSGTAPAVS